MDLMTSMLESLKQPQTLHAMLAHFPVAISVVGLILVIMLMLGGGKSHGMRFAIFTIYLIGALCGFFAYSTGEAAEHAMEIQMAAGTQLTQEAQAALEQHESMAPVVWISLAVVSVASLLSVFKSSGLRVMMLVITVIGALFSAGWVAVTAHLGGKMVYVHGVGVPASPNNLVNPLPKDAEDDEPDSEEPEKPAPETPKARSPKPATESPESESPASTPTEQSEVTPAAPAVPEPETTNTPPAPQPDESAPAPPALPMNDLPAAEDVI